MKTPEQTIEKTARNQAWESCYTMGDAWQHKPTNNKYKTGTQIINMLTEVRAKGGNLLLNVGPKPNGELSTQEEGLLREVALWNAVNGECIHGVRPWREIKQDKIWYTASADGKTVYAIVPQWPYSTRKEFLFKSVKATANTEVGVLGYGNQFVEYSRGKDGTARFENTSMGLLVSVMNGQRMYTNPNWPNPIVIRLKNVEYKPLLKEKVTISALGAQDGVK